MARSKSNVPMVYTTITIPEHTWKTLKEQQVPIISVFRKGLAVINRERELAESYDITIQKLRAEIERLTGRIIQLEHEKVNKV